MKPLFSSMLPRILIDFHPTGHAGQKLAATEMRISNSDWLRLFERIVSAFLSILFLGCAAENVWITPTSEQPNMAEEKKLGQASCCLEPVPKWHPVWSRCLHRRSHKVKWIFRLLNIIEELVKLVKLVTSWLKMSRFCCCSLSKLSCHPEPNY